MNQAGHSPAAGVAFAISAYSFWGIAPLYFSLVEFASPLEIVAHRVLWTLVLLILLVSVRRQWGSLVRLSNRQWRGLFITGLLIAVNWLTFVWALQNERIIETSLGYYIGPLITVCLGAVVLRERLQPFHILALGIATIGVGNEVVQAGNLPWVSLTLAISFALYGLLRKQLAIDSSVGLLVETALMLPIAVALLFMYAYNGVERSSLQLSLLALGGFVTMFPLLCFAAAATRLTLTSLGFFQYIGPSVTLLLAIYVYGEPFTQTKWLTFGFIWLALGIFTVVGAFKQYGQTRGGVAK